MNATITKTNLLKEDPNYYKIGKSPEIRDLDTYYYLTITGISAPEDPLFTQSIEAIYKVAYTLKFKLKELEKDFVVPKMEAFWWIKGGIDNQSEFMNTPRNEWHWKILIRLPDFVEEEDYLIANQLAAEKNPKVSLIKNIQYEKINEGRCVQILHNGSYENEEESINQLFNLINKEGLKVSNYHHEIYLTDPRRTPEDRLKTILRYGVE